LARVSIALSRPAESRPGRRIIGSRERAGRRCLGHAARGSGRRLTPPGGKLSKDASGSTTDETRGASPRLAKNASFARFRNALSAAKIASFCRSGSIAGFRRKIPADLPLGRLGKTGRKGYNFGSHFDRPNGPILGLFGGPPPTHAARASRGASATLVSADVGLEKRALRVSNSLLAGLVNRVEPLGRTHCG
jgi:hypothetical protein